MILNVAVWIALHTVFRSMQHVNGYGFSFDAPVPASIEWWALALSPAAIAAIFRFKAGMIPTLAACSALGVGFYLAGTLR